MGHRRLRTHLIFVRIALVAAILAGILHEALRVMLATALGLRGWRVILLPWGAYVVRDGGAVRSRIVDLLVAWGPVLFLILSGYALYGTRACWRSHWPPRNFAVLSVGAALLCGSLCVVAFVPALMPDSMASIAALGWPTWPIELTTLVLLALNLRLVRRWGREQREDAAAYRERLIAAESMRATPHHSEQERRTRWRQ